MDDGGANKHVKAYIYAFVSIRFHQFWLKLTGQYILSMDQRINR